MRTVHHAHMDLTEQLLERRANGQTYIVDHGECGICENGQTAFCFVTLLELMLLAGSFDLRSPVAKSHSLDTRFFEARLLEIHDKMHARDGGTGGGRQQT